MPGRGHLVPIAVRNMAIGLAMLGGHRFRRAPDSGQPLQAGNG